MFKHRLVKAVGLGWVGSRLLWGEWSALLVLLDGASERRAAEEDVSLLPKQCGEKRGGAGSRFGKDGWTKGPKATAVTTRDAFPF